MVIHNNKDHMVNGMECSISHHSFFKDLARQIRKNVLFMTHRANASHIGSCFSIVEILAVLYGKILNIDSKNPKCDERDRLILSKGHAAAAVYATLAERNFFPKTWLDTYCNDECPLGGHITSNVPGVEVSSGSLGHGLSIGCGMALSAKIHHKKYRVFIIMSDGECDEGSIWEGAMFAPIHKLDNLTIIIDYNKIQSLDYVKNVLDLEPFKKKWESFGWSVEEIDGHDLVKIERVLLKIPFKKNKPNCIIAHTVKGKGVSFMENQVAWHYKSPDKEQLKIALHEIGAEYEE
jgi:transketolase